jgi:protein-L-isoaspartate(D-aspartate) O-methyltransferase
MTWSTGSARGRRPSVHGRGGAPPAGAGSPEGLVRLLRAEGVRDRRVLTPFRGVPRALFVPAEAAGQAYLDEPIPHGQVTTQPSLIAAMVAALALTGGERVLEVGTGLGFQTAILARLARQVVSVERFPDLAAQARANLAAAGVGGVTVVVGDGTLGVPEHAPYQAI